MIENALYLDDRSICDLWMIVDGGFAPLTGFMSQCQYESVLDRMRLTDGTLFPIPITLPVNEEDAKMCRDNIKQKVILRSRRTRSRVADLLVSDVFCPNFQKECVKICGSCDEHHPHVIRLCSYEKERISYVGGDILSPLSFPFYRPFVEHYKPADTSKSYIVASGFDCVIGFQTRNPLHKSHAEIMQRALLTSKKSCILLMPTIGPTQQEDVDAVVRMKCYSHFVQRMTEEGRCVVLLPIPLSMRMVGPREALLHAIVRRNYGCCAFIVGRDHAGPSARKKDGSLFYSIYAAQQLVKQYEKELGMNIICFEEVAFDDSIGKYEEVSRIREGNAHTLSGSELRRLLRQSQAIPHWFTYPEIENELRNYYNHLEMPKRTCIWFTGLSGSGKSTLAEAVKQTLIERFDIKICVVILDGDEVRKSVTKELGFDRRSRREQVVRVAWLAKTMVEAGVIVICALISPYEEDRKEAKKIILCEEGVRFFQIYLSAPLASCKSRDAKGLYKAALPCFTGIDDPYEPPKNPNLTVNTEEMPLQIAVSNILNLICKGS